MKFLVFIFAVYLLGLSCLSCHDEAADSGGIQLISQSGDDEHSHGGEYCSPFCVCACCGLTLSSLPQIANIINLPVFYTTIETTCRQVVLQGHLSNVWQPPRKV